MKVRPGSTREGLLPDDFARRVTRRVEQIKRRRQVRRRVLAMTGVLAVVVGTAFFWRQAQLSDSQPVAIRNSPSTSAWPAYAAMPEAASGQGENQSLVGYFFPDADPVRDFNQLYGEDGWHSYDSWWTSNS
jgi:hypothetical protein